MAERLGTLLPALERLLTQRRTLPLAPTLRSASVRAQLAQRYGVLRTPHDPQRVQTDVYRLLEAGTAHTTHPRHYGMFNTSVTEESIVAEALSSAFNPQLATRAAAPAATAMERFALDALGRALGFETIPRIHASFTTGGAEANLSALAIALTATFPAVARDGLRALPAQPVFYRSAQAHPSLDKAAHVLGLGRRAVRIVPTDAADRMDVAALGTLLREDRAQGLWPFAVVATLGTTGTGALDPLDPLTALCQEQSLWLHVDGAYGAALALSPVHAPLVGTLGRADSLVLDAHKALSVPNGAGMLFCRHPDAVRQTFSAEGPYMPIAREGDPYTETLQWSRRFTGLKVFLRLAERGLDAIGCEIASRCRLADRLREELRTNGFDVREGTPVPVVCFTHSRIASGELSARSVADRILADGAGWIHVLRREHGPAILRAGVTHAETTDDDIRTLVEALARAVTGTPRERTKC